MQTLILHMHGLGDMVMFAPTFNKLPNKNKTIDIIVFENNAIKPLKTSKKINKIYYCDSSYLKLIVNLFKILLIKYELIIFSNNSSPFKSFFISMILDGRKKIFLSEKNIFIKFRNIHVINVKRNLHKIYRNLLLINFKKKTKLNKNLYFKKVKSPLTVDKKKINVGIHPGSNLKNGDKRWDVDKFIQIINFLILKNCNIFIFIGKYEYELLNKMKFNSENVKIIFNKDLDYVADVIKKMNLILSNETGIAHISSFLNVKTFVIINKLYDFDKTKISIPLYNTIFQKKTIDNKDISKIKKYLITILNL